MHVDPVTVGTLEGVQLSRALKHARSCERCRVPVERVLLATRVLERGTAWEPTEAEVDAAGHAGLAAVLDSARPRRRWPVFTGVGVALAAAASIVLVVTRPPEFMARGGGEGRVVLRVFCVPFPEGIRELSSGGRCPQLSKLAFAAGAAPELSSAAVRLGTGSTGRVLGPFTVSGPPGAEAPLDATPIIDDPVGPLEVTAAFASTPERALAALRGERVEGAVVLRQRFEIEAIR